MSQPETLPAVLAWLAERWPERCIEGPGPIYTIWIGDDEGLDIDPEHYLQFDIAAAEYLIRELIAEAGWKWTLHQAIFEDRYSATIHELTSEKTYRLRAWKDAPTPLLALANAFREALGG